MRNAGNHPADLGTVGQGVGVADGAQAQGAQRGQLARELAAALGQAQGQGLALGAQGGLFGAQLLALALQGQGLRLGVQQLAAARLDRKSTRLNSSHRT